MFNYILLLFSIFGMAMGDFNLLIFHHAGIQSSWTGTDANGGSVENAEKADFGGHIRTQMIKISEARKHIANGGSVLNLNAGGTFGSNPQFKVISDKDPKIAAELNGKFMNASNYDAAVPGNHEFDLGLEGWNEYMITAGVNTDTNKLYLVDDEAYCYESETQFLEDNESNWKKIDFQKPETYNAASNVPIFVGANFIEKIYFSVASQNMVEPVVRMKRSVVRLYKTSNGIVPVGIIGYLSLDTKHESKKRLNELAPTKVILLGDELAYVKKESDRLNFMGVYIIFALGFSGINIDRNIAELPLINGVIGGFSHTFMYNGQPIDINDKPSLSYPELIPKTQSGENRRFTPIVHTPPFMKYLGTLVLKFKDNGTLILNDYADETKALSTFTSQTQNPILVSGSISKSSSGELQLPYVCNTIIDIASMQAKDFDDMNTLIQEWIIEYQKQLKESGIEIKQYREIEKFIEGGDLCKKRECELGAVIADSHLALYEKVKHDLGGLPENLFPHAIGVVNAGAVRAHLGDQFTSSNNKKQVTTYEIMQVLLGNSPIVVVQMTQHQILDMFKCSISQWNHPTPSGRLLQVSSNVRVIYNFEDVTDTITIEKVEINVPKINVTVFDGTAWVNILDSKFENMLFHVVTNKHCRRTSRILHDAD